MEFEQIRLIKSISIKKILLVIVTNFKNSIDTNLNKLYTLEIQKDVYGYLEFEQIRLNRPISLKRKILYHSHEF